VDIINRIITLNRRNDNNKSLSPIFDELFDYVTEHFNHEEELFAEYNYPETKEHIFIHKDILNKVQELSSQSKKIHPETLLVFLKSWIKYHFGVVDQKYSKFLIEKGVE
jgi:hemerythrin-like metal-binding protein